MSHPILITGAAGGPQGSTGRLVAGLLLKKGIPVRAFVHKLDARSDELRQQGAEIIQGDLLNPASVQAAMKEVKRAYFTYPVADGLLEAATIFAATARDAGLELVVNNSQFQGAPMIPDFAISNALPHSGICSIGWPIVSSSGRRSVPFIFRRLPTTKTYALLSAGAYSNCIPPSQPNCFALEVRPCIQSDRFQSIEHGQNVGISKLLMFDRKVSFKLAVQLSPEFRSKSQMSSVKHMP